MGVPGLLPDAYLRLQSITRCLLVTSVYYLTPYGGPQSITRPLINSYYSLDIVLLRCVCAVCPWCAV